MKLFHFVIVTLLFYSCNSKEGKVTGPVSTDQSANQTDINDTALVFQYQTNFIDRNIINKSDRKVDLLFNGVDNFLGGHRNSAVSFNTECMTCQSVQVFKDALVFGKRLLITPANIRYYKKNVDLPDSVHRLTIFSDGGSRANQQFDFQGGKGTINYIGVSCNDADFNRVRLTFSTGELIIDSLINASFFEYDLDADGQNEQYIYGLRNCSQELVILRTRK